MRKNTMEMKLEIKCYTVPETEWTNKGEKAPRPMDRTNYGIVEDGSDSYFIPAAELVHILKVIKGDEDIHGKPIIKKVPKKPKVSSLKKSQRRK